MADKRKGISPFSVLLLMAVTAVVGAACFSMLKVQYTPSSQDKQITVTYGYPGASSRIVEAEVTSKLEGVLSNIKECKSVRSVSNNGDGSITLEFGKRVDLQSARFEIASQIRNVYPSLPRACSYPVISLNSSGNKSQTAISFYFLSSLPSKEIADFVENRIMYPISTIKGVEDVSFYGNTPYEWVVTFDYDIAKSLGITADDISKAFADRYSENLLGMVTSGNMRYGVRLKGGSVGDMSDIPVKNVGGRIVRLGEIAQFRYQEALPTSYYRINGLITLNLAVAVGTDVNLISVVGAVKDKMHELEASFPEEITAKVNYDSSEYVSAELNKIYFRTLFCLLILLIFAFLVNRSWRYMVVVAITLMVSILISVCLYWLVGLEIHIYTLAGVTVSLGIIIDNTIVMVDHYSRYGNRSVFPALLSAIMTTVAALLVIFLLPEQERASLTEFAVAIIINLCVSLLVAYLFVPALLYYFPVNFNVKDSARAKRLRRIAWWNRGYGRYIGWGIRHRWLLVLGVVIAFGIPTCLIPKDFEWKPYSDHRKVIDKVLGTSFALFYKAMDRSDFYREPSRPCLTIRAGMPEGCTVQQLNEVLRSMENYLSGIVEIESFETGIYSPSSGTIQVYFKPEVEDTSLPSMVKGDVILMAASFGGANWTVFGIDDNGFNNNIVTSYRSNGVKLTGYNYDQLLRYGEHLLARMSSNRRVSGAEIWGVGSYDRPQGEFCVDYDFEALKAVGISPYEYYSSLRSPLYDSYAATIPYDGKYVNVRIESSSKDVMDLWHVDNVAVEAGEGRMKLSQIGEISKKNTSLPIQKENQSYSITVRFDFLGPLQMSSKYTAELVDYMNGSVLPVGYKAEDNQGRWFYDNQDKYAALILLVIACIFVICAVHFNSLRYPIAIIVMIPVSFIGEFLVFGLSDFAFDKGGFAAFVMLSGITVNAGIYLISAFKKLLPEQGWSIGHPGYKAQREHSLQVHTYVRAFNSKIIPIFLTIVSSVIGLVPFLFDGPSEVFWFDFAIGTIAGLVMSVVALILLLPVFALKKQK